MPKPQPAVYREMTPNEERMALAVMFPRVNYLPGSPDKRFSISIGYAALNTTGHLITDSQADYLRRLVKRYRRQLPDAIRALAAIPTQTEETNP